ncbi:MAG: geranyl-CoA carboxylase beta subunit [Myxococcota bacterium]|jgi:geranyl-CoA carboxylase beta subunit
MPVIDSTIDPHSEAFATNRAEMIALVEEIRVIEARIRAHSDRAAPKFAKRGQLLPRERVARLLDPGSPFLELSSLAGFGMHDDDGKDKVAGGGNIIGVGMVSGVRCLITANDAGIKGGSITPMGLQKSLRSQEIALRQRLPTVSLVESGGANLLHQSEIFVDGGRVFCNMARLSAAGIPQITVVHGSATAGGAYMPGLSDYVIAVKERAKIFLAGPPLVKAALGEEATEADLGGAEMHAEITGLVEYLAENDAHGIHLARQVIDQLGLGTPASVPDFEPPLHAPDELCGVVPVDTRQPYDVHEVIARLVDGSRFLGFKSRFGAETVCGHAAIEGARVGIIGNNGPIQPEGSLKAAQFIQLCQQAGLPLVFLMNTTGYMVGTEAEQKGAVKHGAKMIQAVACCTVPKVTVIIGGGYGAGNYGMCGRSYEPDFIFSWPNSKVAVMGGQQAGEVMKIITRASYARRGLPIVEEVLEHFAGELSDKLESQTSALFATARIWDDGVIDPRDTRTILAMSLRIAVDSRRRALSPSTFGVARG